VRERERVCTYRERETVLLAADETTVPRAREREREGEGERKRERNECAANILS
jgi:hypothetical protein